MYLFAIFSRYGTLFQNVFMAALLPP